MHADPALIRSVKAHVSPGEWAVRQDLAAAYRAVACFGWDDLVFTHISARVPGGDHHFLINPYGMMFEEITASSLVKVDLAGRKVMDSPFEINPAGFTIHGAVHEAREDAQCVMHLHTIEGVAVSCQKAGLLAISQQSLFPLASLAYHDYEGVALNPEEKARLVRDLGDRQNMILRNHGLLTCGEAVADASSTCTSSRRRARCRCARRRAAASWSPCRRRSSTASSRPRRRCCGSRAA